MAQGTYTIANQAGASFRAAVNTLMGIIRSRNSGATEPSETAADMIWVDTANGVIKRRNSGDSGWVLDGSRADAPTRSTATGITLAVSDHMRHVLVTGAGGITLAFTAAATLTDGWSCIVRNDGSAAVTLDPNGAETIDGATTFSLPAGNSVVVWCDGLAFYTVSPPTIRLGTPVAAAGQTSIDFTSIPATAKRIKVLFSGLSLSGTSSLLVQLGDSGGVETTGYVSCAIIDNGSTTLNSTSGFVLTTAGVASNAWRGKLTLDLMGTNAWCGDGTLVRTSGAEYSGGDKTLSGTLDRVRITTVNGTDTFDAGSVNVSWEA